MKEKYLQSSEYQRIGDLTFQIGDKLSVRDSDHEYSQPWQAKVLSVNSVGQPYVEAIGPRSCRSPKYLWNEKVRIDGRQP